MRQGNIRDIHHAEHRNKKQLRSGAAVRGVMRENTDTVRRRAMRERPDAVIAKKKRLSVRRKISSRFNCGLLALLAAVALFAAASEPAAIFAAGTDGGSHADPVQANSSATATIYLGKILTVSQEEKFPAISDFTFNLENIRAWDNANASAGQSGKVIPAAEMPQPSASNTAHHTVHVIDSTNARITAGDFSGNANTAAADTKTGKYRTTPVNISFSKAGYYMYRLSEDIANTEKIPGMAYDSNSYYVVVYVCNKTDANGNTQKGVYVHDITAYRNSADSAAVAQPDLSDIQNVTDNNGVAASENNYTNYAKVGISEKTPGRDPGSGLPTGPDKLEAFRFYNDQTTHDLVVTNNVTGNLGDITKEFEYTVSLTGLEKNRTYTTTIPAQDKRPDAPVGYETSSGADIEADRAGKGSIDAERKTFTSDADGSASFRIRLADDETMVLNALPATSKYQLTEQASDHIASFKAESTEPETWIMTKSSDANTHSDMTIATNTETVDAVSNVPGRSGQAAEDNDGTVTISFTNHRDLATPTGLPYYGDLAYVMTALMIGAAVILIIKRRKRSPDSNGRK